MKWLEFPKHLYPHHLKVSLLARSYQPGGEEFLKSPLQVGTEACSFYFFTFSQNCSCSCHKRASVMSILSGSFAPKRSLQEGMECSKEMESDLGLIFYNHKNTLKNPTLRQSGALTEVTGGRRGRRKD